MKITVITGSLHKRGTSELLTDRFIEGAKWTGHKVSRFNAAFEEIHPCLGYGRCGRKGPCIHRDGHRSKIDAVSNGGRSRDLRNTDLLFRHVGAAKNRDRLFLCRACPIARQHKKTS